MLTAVENRPGFGTPRSPEDAQRIAGKSSCLPGSEFASAFPLLRARVFPECAPACSGLAEFPARAALPQYGGAMLANAICNATYNHRIGEIMPGSLSGKVALLTGAVRRNGRASALGLAADGASVVINTRNS